MEQMTIFYNKRTGSVKELCQGVQTTDWFGDEKEDYEQIFDLIVLGFDEYVIQNFTQFEVLDGELKLKSNSNLSKYT